MTYGTATVMLAQTRPADEVPLTMKTTDPAGTDAPENWSLTPFCVMPALKDPIEMGNFVVVLTPLSVVELSEMPVTVVEPVLRTLNWTVTMLLFLLLKREPVTASMMIGLTLTEDRK